MKPKLPPPLILIIAGGLMYAIAHNLSFGNLQSFFFFPYQDIIAKVFFTIGVLIALHALHLFHKAKTTHNPIKIDQASSLVTTGIYRFTRNPMYLGMLIILIGFGIKLGSTMALGVIPIFVLAMKYLQIVPEERVLLEIFGDEYAEYCEKVRRWI